jgi:hypothetical protein
MTLFGGEYTRMSKAPLHAEQWQWLIAFPVSKSPKARNLRRKPSPRLRSRPICRTVRR